VYLAFEQRSKLKDSYEHISRLNYDIIESQSTISLYKDMNTNKVTVTAYTTSIDETNSDPSHTSMMDEPIPGWTIAVSRDLVYLKGKRVWIEGMGIRKVNDVMNKRYKKRIDVLVGDKETAREFGIKKKINLVLIEPELLAKDIINELRKDNLTMNLLAAEI
jgi:3D (Asp-Asp-Asp) domain-containing protein